MAFKHDHLASWLESAAPAESLVSYVATHLGRVDTGQTGVTSSHGDRQRDRFANSLGLEMPYGSGLSNTFYALTDRSLLLGTRSGMRNRPKDLLHSSPIDQVAVYGFDHDEHGGNRFRHFVTDFGDGTMRADRTGLTVLGKTLKSSTAEPFVEALGPRARPMPVD